MILFPLLEILLLAVLYPHPGHSLAIRQAVTSLLILIFITAMVIYLSRKSAHLLVGWLWYLGTLIPVIGLVQVGSQAMADRYTYLPLTGIFIMAAWEAARLSSKRRYRKIVLGISAGLAGQGTKEGWHVRKKIFC